MSKLSVIIVNYNTCELVVNCLQSICRHLPHIPLEMIVVDNASVDDSAETIRQKFPDVMLFVNQANVGFAAANNLGIQAATGDYVLLLNSDTLVTEGALDQLISFLESHPDVAAAAPRLLNGDGSFQRSFFQFPNAAKVFLHILGVDRLLYGILQWRYLKSLTHFLMLAHYKQDFDLMETREVPYVLFACIAFRREVFKRVGLLDDAIFFYHEDCEFGYRLFKGGMTIWWVPSSQVIHLGGGSSRSVSRMAFQNYYRSLLYIFQKHESSAHYWALKGAILSGFLIKAFFTVFGFYSTLEIPTTYKNLTKNHRDSFAALPDRVRYYLTIARSALWPLAKVR